MPPVARDMSARIKSIHSSHNLGRKLPLGSPCETGAPSIKDLVEDAVNGEGEGVVEEGASAWPGDQDRGKLLQHGLEMASA